MNAEQQISGKTMVITCTDFLEPVFGSDNTVILRGPCNGLDYARPGVVESVLETISKEQCNHILIVGHLPCRSLENFLTSKSILSGNRSMQQRILTIQETVRAVSDRQDTDFTQRIAEENIRVESRLLLHYIKAHNPVLDIEVSGLMILPSGKKYVVETSVSTSYLISHER